MVIKQIDQHSIPNSLAYWGFVSVLIWTPIPFASVTLVGQLGFALAVGIIFMVAILDRQLVWLTNGAQKCACGLICCVQAFVVVQFLITWKTETTLTLDLGGTQIALVVGIAYLLLFLLGTVLIDTTNRVRYFYVALILSGALQSTYGSLMLGQEEQYTFFLKKLDTNIHFATGTFINRNHFGAYLCLTLAAGIGLLLSNIIQNKREQNDSKYMRLLFFVISGKGAIRMALVVITIGLLLTRSRMANISFAVALTLSAVIFIYYSPNLRRKAIGLVTSIIVIDLFIFGLLFDAKETIQRIQQTDIITEGRVNVVLDSLEIVQDNFWLGTGAGTFYTTYPSYQSKPSGNNFWSHAHNDYVEFLSERGIFSFLFLASFICFTLKRSWMMIRSSNDLCKGIGTCVLFSCIAMLAHASVEFNLQIPAYAATFMTILSLAYSPPVQRQLNKT